MKEGRICNQCDRPYCMDCIDDHSCEDVTTIAGLELPQWTSTASDSDAGESSRGNLVAGAILMATGAILVVTGIGAVVGIPLGLLGFSIMFPRFTAAMVVLAAISILYLM